MARRRSAHGAARIPAGPRRLHPHLQGLLASTALGTASSSGPATAFGSAGRGSEEPGQGSPGPGTSTNLLWACVCVEAEERRRGGERGSHGGAAAPAASARSANQCVCRRAGWTCRWASARARLPHPTPPTPPLPASPAARGTARSGAPVRQSARAGGPRGRRRRRRERRRKTGRGPAAQTGRAAAPAARSLWV